MKKQQEPLEPVASHRVGGALEYQLQPSHSAYPEEPYDTVGPYTPEDQLTLESKIQEVDQRVPTVATPHLSRLGADTEEARSNLNAFADLVATVESEGDPKAQNKNTSAAGAFQFVKGSVLPALNRMEKATGTLPMWAAKLKDTYKSGKVTKDMHRDLITGLTYDQQKEIFLGDIMQKKISNQSGLGDKLLTAILLKGDKDAMKELYYKGHHTDPDEATRQRTNSIITEGGKG